MKALKAAELRERTVEELEAMIEVEHQNLYNTRRDLVFRKTSDTTGLKARRHNIARMLGVIGEKKRGAQ